MPPKSANPKAAKRASTTKSPIKPTSALPGLLRTHTFRAAGQDPWVESKAEFKERFSMLLPSSHSTAWLSAGSQSNSTPAKLPGEDKVEEE